MSRADFPNRKMACIADEKPTPGMTPGGMYSPWQPSPAPYSTFKPDGGADYSAFKPGAGYSAFKEIPGQAPAPPSPCESRSGSDYTEREPGTSCSATPSPEGIYVSAEDVKALQQWAEDRESLNDRLNQVEELASQKADEAAELRKRLEESEAALKRATAEAEQRPATCERERSPLKPVSARHTAAEANALATERKKEREQKKRDEASAMRDELRKLRSARAEQVESARCVTSKRAEVEMQALRL